MELTLNKAVVACVLFEAAVMFAAVCMTLSLEWPSKENGYDLPVLMMCVVGFVLIVLLIISMLNIVLFVFCLIKKKWITSFLMIGAGIIFGIIYIGLIIAEIFILIAPILLSFFDSSFGCL